MTPEQLAKRAVDDFNIYQAQAWAVGHASTSEELVKLMTVAIEKAVIKTKQELLVKMLEIRLWDLIATILNALEAATSDRSQVRRDALLDVCKMQCWMCEENKKLEPGEKFNHKMNGWLAECHAHDVRRMIEADQGQGGERS
jgi:hypothetical protein